MSSSEEENGKTPALARFSVSLPEELLEAFDRWIQRQSLGTRSEALRKLIRRFISESLWEERSGEVCGTLTLLYDHHSRDAVGELTRLEHDFEDVIVCTTHIHLDHDHCLEAVLLKGPTCRARAFSEALMEKGLLYAAPSLTPLKESLWGRS
ncbi:transcriptional regulator NikR, CopG family [Aminomonas paucivorans DSM 12260]|uniref:Putative nickel-responsive regulator n=1 Tax=Aminomonas paucivorans DSM 12260 TaxID=584708 RepID=E3D0M2_9BACT|nr:nickel-responsive transcriptional regulator NikR [Aminomonas paucivorans]EFQ23843.1 transcriptional regulator NikR, CopG family [Aminomonas paucivorans DSM 12260]